MEARLEKKYQQPPLKRSRVMNNFLVRVNIGIIEKGDKTKKSFLPDTILNLNNSSLLATSELLFKLEYPQLVIRRVK